MLFIPFFIGSTFIIYVFAILSTDFLMQFLESNRKTAHIFHLFSQKFHKE